ncbi:hypothetical protein ACFE04_027519 [Oxalis oulophora]
MCQGARNACDCNSNAPDDRARTLSVELGSFDEAIARVIDQDPLVRALNAAGTEFIHSCISGTHILEEAASNLNSNKPATVVAVLIATVAFAAIFTVPGQFNEKSKAGSSLGQAKIADKPAFLIFFVTDSLALFVSLAVVVVHVQTSVVVIEQKAKRQLVFVINKLMWLACLCISIAFISLTFVVVRGSMLLALYTTVIGGTIMVTTIGSMCYCVVVHRREETKLRNIRRAESRSHSFSVSMHSDPEISHSDFKRMYAL